MIEPINIIILNHGRFGEEIIKSAELITGKIENIKAVSLLAGMSIEEYYDEVRTYLSDLKGNIILLTDLYGGTPSNVGMMLQQEFSLHMICGFNLPMLIELILSRNNKKKNLDEWITSILHVAKDAILIPNRINIDNE